MSNSLGTIFVDLQANVGGFVSGLSKAAAEAQKFSKETSRSFRDLGEIASQTFGAFGEEFNPVISKLSFVLSSAGSAASSAMKEFSSLGGALGPIAALGAGAAIGIAAAGATMIGVAVHAAESAEKLMQLSRSTGVSVEALSALQFAGRQTGIEQEQLVKSLQLLSSKMVMAAQAPAGTATAFSRLGLAIRQQNGDLKNAASFMGEIITKLSEMRDKTAAVGLARQMMGRGGAVMLQLGDPKELEHWIDAAQRLGIVLDTKTAAAAEDFEQTLGLIRAGAQGTAYRMMADLLPALQAVATELEKAATSSNSFGKDFIWTLEQAIKGAIVFGEAVASVFEQIGITYKRAGAEILSFIDLIETASKLSMKSLMKGGLGPKDFSSAEHAFQDFLSGQKASAQQFAADTKNIWRENADFFKHVYGGIASDPLGASKNSTFHPGLGEPSGPSASGRPDVVAELIAKLEAQAAAELALASATEKSVAASLLAKAAAEAEVRIGETRARLIEQEKSLQEQLADARNQADAGQTGAGVRALRLQAEVDGLHRMIAELEKSAPQIKALYAEIASAGFAAKSSAELEKFTIKTNEQTAALREMAAAYSEGPLAAQRAQENAKIAPFEKQHSDLGELIPALKTAGAPDADIAKLQAAYDQLGAAIGRAKASVAAFTAAEISEKIAKEKEQLTSEAAAYAMVGQAALKSAETQREAAARAEAIKFGAAHPTATSGQLDEVYATALAKLNQQRAATIAQTAAQFDLNASYSQEIEKLQEIRSFLLSSGESTIAIDAKIYEARIQHMLDYQKQVFDSQNAQLLGEEKISDQADELTRRWDRAANSVGTIGEKFRAMLNEIQLQGEDFGSKVFGTFSKSIDDLSTHLSQFIVTGKNSFRQMIESWSEELLKLSFQKTFSLILGKIFPQPGQNQSNQNQPWSEQVPGMGGKGGLGGVAGAIGSFFGIKAPGTSGGKPSGTASDPLYVAIVSAAAAAGGTSPGGMASTFGGLSGLPVVGGIFGDIGKMFGTQGTTATGGKPDGSQSNPIYTVSTGAPNAGAASSISSATSSLNSLPIVGPALGSLGNLFGAATGTGAPDGSQSNPFYVVSSSSGSGGGDLLSSLMGDGGSSGGDSSGGGGDLFSLFMDAGGFMAGGGRASKGTPYIVGEDRPEVFVPDEHGKIVPSIAHFANSPEGKAMKFHGMNLSAMARRENGGSVLSGMPYLTGEKRPEVFVPNSSYSSGSRFSRGEKSGEPHIHLEFPNVRDHDTFRKSSAQIHSELQHQAAIAYQRNR
jgi:hypothetical protein